MIIDGALAASPPIWIPNGGRFRAVSFPIPTRLRDAIPCTERAPGERARAETGTGWIDRTSGEDERKSRTAGLPRRATAAIDKPVANRY